jgi:hypothetical protein
MLRIYLDFGILEFTSVYVRPHVPCAMRFRVLIDGREEVRRKDQDYRQY